MDTFERVRGVLVETLHVSPDEVTPEASLKHDLGADSLYMVQIVMGLEDEFGIQIEDEGGPEPVTVRELADSVDAKLGVLVAR